MDIITTPPCCELPSQRAPASVPVPRGPPIAVVFLPAEQGVKLAVDTTRAKRASSLEDDGARLGPGTGRVLRRQGVALRLASLEHFAFEIFVINVRRCIMAFLVICDLAVFATYLGADLAGKRPKGSDPFKHGSLTSWQRFCAPVRSFTLSALVGQCVLDVALLFAVICCSLTLCRVFMIGDFMRVSVQLASGVSPLLIYRFAFTLMALRLAQNVLFLWGLWATIRAAHPPARLVPDWRFQLFKVSTTRTYVNELIRLRQRQEQEQSQRPEREMTLFERYMQLTRESQRRESDASRLQRHLRILEEHRQRQQEAGARANGDVEAGNIEVARRDPTAERRDQPTATTAGQDPPTTARQGGPRSAEWGFASISDSLSWLWQYGTRLMWSSPHNASGVPSTVDQMGRPRPPEVREATNGASGPGHSQAPDPLP